MITEPYSKKFKDLAINFDCGNRYLNDFLESDEALDPGITKTFVVLSDDETEVIGYYSLDCGAVDQVSGTYHEKIGGAIHVRCFALGIEHKHQVEQVASDGTKLYLSDIIFIDCLNRIEYIRSHFVGAEFVTLASTREGGKLYRRHGFDNLDDDISFSTTHEEDECVCLYLPLDYE